MVGAGVLRIAEGRRHELIDKVPYFQRRCADETRHVSTGGWAQCTILGRGVMLLNGKLVRVSTVQARGIE